MLALSGDTQQVLSVVKHIHIKVTQMRCISPKIKKTLHTVDSLLIEQCNILFKFDELLIQGLVIHYMRQAFCFN